MGQINDQPIADTMSQYDDQEEFDDDVFDEFDSEEDNTIACPFCSTEIYFDAEICPHCGNFIIDDEVMEHERHSPYPTWVVWTAMILLALILSGLTCLL